MSTTRRYATWIHRHRVAAVVVSVVVALAGIVVARTIPVRGDLGALLPPDTPSVRDLARLGERARPFSTVQVVIESPSPYQRARAAAALRARIEALPEQYIAMFLPDDGAQLRYGWAHRFLFASVEDLVAARDALRDRIDRARLAANPLYIDLDDGGGTGDGLAELERRLARAERDARRPPPRVSRDGTVELFTIQTALALSDDDRIAELIELLEGATAELAWSYPGVRFGFSGNAVRSHLEKEAVLAGMTRSIVVTALLCAVALLYYYRSARIVLAISCALAVGVIATFAVARLVVGQLDMLSAFLAAIVIGNGINASLIVTARVLEELRDRGETVEALQRGIAGALRGTIAAAASAVVAYGSLMATDFRGFSRFGTIAAIGMALTWLATFTVLPALLAMLTARRPLRARAEPALGRLLARWFGTRPGLNIAIGSTLALAALVIVARFVAGNPFTRDWRDLQSSTAAIEEAAEVDAKARLAQGPVGGLTASAFQIVYATADAATAAQLVETLRARTDLFREARSLADFLPPDQPAKLAVLADIRALLDSPAIAAALSPDELARIRALRPPDDLRPLTLDDIPDELAWPYIEQDGSRGRLVLARGKSSYEPYDIRGRRELAAAVRRMELPPGTLAAGEALVVADIIDSMESDAPIMTLLALAGSVLAVVLVLGWRRQAWVTIACGLTGVIAMIAVCALAGVRVHFIDLVALPLTIGIGMEYAANLAARDRIDGVLGPDHVLRTTGSAVLLCSYTTAVGYGTLLLSANGGVRAFGLAALVGELTCLLVALAIAPAALSLLRRRHARVSAK